MNLLSGRFLKSCLFFFILPLMTQAQSVINIRAVGDMMIGNAPTQELPSHFVFENVASILRAGDITVGNHEGTLCDSDIRGRKCPEALKPGQLCYAFRTPTRYIQQFVEAGFDVLHLANNHIFDYYEDCANTTQQTIESNGIASLGLLPRARTQSPRPR
ncbi:MAG: CapA family protein [Bdellovibrio sp.]